MKIKQIKIYFTLVGLLVSIANVYAQDWPQYLGPRRNSTSPEKGILRSWPEKGPDVLWTVEVGPGFGGPVINNGKVYLLDRDDNVGDIMRCFDLSSGKELWRFSYDAPGSVRYPGSRSVPVVDGNYVYSCGHNGDLYCIDINTHKPVWNKNVWTDFGGGQIPTWAITQCPLIYGNLLIIASQAPQAGVVAYNKLNGNMEWKTPSLGAVGYVSPAIVKISGEDHVVMITAATGRGQSASGGKVVGINPLTGKILWEYTNWQCIIPVPSAVDVGEGRVLITGGYEAGAAMIKVVKKADGTFGVTELYKNIDFGDHTKPPILHNGYFYAQYSTNERRDGLACMSIDGKVIWKTMRNPLFDKGSMILVDGVILATDGNRSLYVIEPDPSGFKPLASAAILNAGQNWGPMALSNGKLLIRDQRQLMCVRVTK
ncbi:MAG: PQQ-like beta-propeller repeat protein [Bacteroidales bacterium]|nr:PQQ-like beta-propeller repeat protein [Bacteroidales bacterium]